MFVKSRGNLNVEWAVRPPGSNVAAMPEDKKLVVLSNFFIRKDKNNTFNYGQDIRLHKQEIVFSNISAKVAWCHNISF